MVLRKRGRGIPGEEGVGAGIEEYRDTGIQREGEGQRERDCIDVKWMARVRSFTLAWPSCSHHLMALGADCSHFLYAPNTAWPTWAAILPLPILSSCMQPDKTLSRHKKACSFLDAPILWAHPCCGIVGM